MRYAGSGQREEISPRPSAWRTPRAEASGARGHVDKTVHDLREARLLPGARDHGRRSRSGLESLATTSSMPMLTRRNASFPGELSNGSAASKCRRRLRALILGPDRAALWGNWRSTVALPRGCGRAPSPAELFPGAAPVGLV